MEEIVTVQDCLKALNLEVINREDCLNIPVKRPYVSRPGVEIYSGYFELYEHNRIQVIGTKEINLFYMLSEDIRAERVNKLFEALPPAFVFTRNVTEVPNEFIEASNKYNIPLLRSHGTTTFLVSALGAYLSGELAEKKSFHGVMMDINGIGVMLTGKSRIGKSETALQLLMRGHTLISDDRVDIAQPSVGILDAYCPKIIERLLEVRGLGIVDVVDLFGAKAFRNRKQLMLIVELKSESEEKNVNRLGIDDEYQTIFDTKVPKVTVYVKPGRNLAALVEVAAMSWRLKTLGKNAALEFSEKLNAIVRSNDV